MKKLILLASSSVIIGIVVGLFLSTQVDFSDISSLVTTEKSETESLLSPDTISVNRESLSDDAFKVGKVGLTINQGATIMTLPELFSRAQQSVVQVSDTDEQHLLASTMGSGFVYDTNGHIITNNHVIANSPSQDVDVTFLDGTVYKAKIIGSDPFSDLAVLYTQDVPKNKLFPMPVGNSGALRVGEQVVAIGNPFGLSGSMTEGIVSGLGRILPSSSSSPAPSESEETLRAQFGPTFSIPDIIQTDAAVNPGNSGGPLLNMRGEVVGINTAIFSTTGVYSGVGFAIPSNTIQKVVPALISTGSYSHPWLGIAGTDITPEIADKVGLKEPRGFLVTDSTSGGPADRAGIRGGYQQISIDGRELLLGGDIIIAIDDKTVRKIDDILTYLEREKDVGDSVKLTVLRANGQINYIDVMLGSRPST
ncbi:MAG TPA: trypsin-like peptidase domain-containing protein [Nitrososphaeraceae archaeon]